jgi:hypothetical protein
LSSQYTNTYALGSTIAVVGLSSITGVFPGKGVNGGFLKILSGAGSLAIAPGLSSPGFWGATLYPIGASEIISFSGPARFYLAASTATMIASITFSYTSGLSSPLAGA